MAERGLRFPRVMPARFYRDPAEVLEHLVIAPVLAVQNLVSHETCRVQPHAPRDRFYTQARRLHIRNLMRARR